MKPIIDPRDGDIEDDESSTKRRSLFSLAGSLLVEISLPKLAMAWTLLRTVSALAAIHGTRVRVLDRISGGLGGTLAQALEPHLAEMVAFADGGSAGRAPHSAS